MRLLDVGCGPGTITLGLAQAVTPGEVVGVDIQASQIDQARALAAEGRRECNLRGHRHQPSALSGRILRRRLCAHRDDAPRAVRALEEMRRMLRPGGLIGIRDPDWGADLFAPEMLALEQFRALRVRVPAAQWRQSFFGRQQRRCWRPGFGQAEATASSASAGTPGGDTTTCHMAPGSTPGLRPGQPSQRVGWTRRRWMR